MPESHVIEAGGRFSARLEPGDRCVSSTPHGQQAVDFLCYSASLPVDRYNAANTMKINGNIYLGKGTEALFRSRPGADAHRGRYAAAVTTPSAAVAARGAISPATASRIRQAATPNFIAELASWSLSPADVVPNVNFFMNVPVRQDGAMAIEDGLSKAGDYVELVAEVAGDRVLSNCPQRNNPAAGFGPTPIEVIVSRDVTTRPPLHPQRPGSGPDRLPRPDRHSGAGRQHHCRRCARHARARTTRNSSMRHAACCIRAW